MAAITGTKKAAMLLMRLDPGSASELLKVVKPATATEIATEMAYLNASGGAGEEEEAAALSAVREFSTLLSGSDSDWSLGFVRQMLESAMPAEQSAQAFEEVKQRLDYRDPFASIRETKLHELAAALEGEPPQVMSLVLAELPAKSSAELLGLFEEEIGHQVIRGMAGATNVSVEAKVRVASVIKTRLQELRSSGSGAADGNAREAQIRKVSVLLRGLAKETRDQMIASIKEQDPETGALVMKMMVVWEDMPFIGDRALQEALRASDPRKLALALVDVDNRIADKIKMNLSETGRNMVYEESLLLTTSKPKAIVEARDLLLQDLRELNDAGMLEFEEA